MTRSQFLVTAFIVTLLAISLATAIGIIAVGQSRRRELGPDHPGVTVSTPPLPPTEYPTFVPATPHPAPQRPAGRHHPDTVRTVPEGWMPATGADRIRALEDTRRFEAPNEGGSR